MFFFLTVRTNICFCKDTTKDMSSIDLAILQFYAN